MLQNLLVFGGKGGVGKSSISAATAVYLAEKLPEKSILLISFDIAHNLSDIFKAEVGSKITPITHNLFAIEPDPEEYAEKYTRSFANKTQKLLKSTFIVGAIPELEKFVSETFRAKNIPLALKNALFFQSLLDAENPLEEEPGHYEFFEGDENQVSKKKAHMAQSEFDIIVADFPPTGNMVALFEIPQDSAKELLQYSLEMVSTVQKYLNRIKKVGKVLNPLNWGKKETVDEKKNLAQEILDGIHNLEQRGERISQLMRGIGSLRLVTIAEKPSYEEIKRAEELCVPYIALDGVHINRLIPENLLGKTEFLDKIIANQRIYSQLIEESFESFKIWHSEYLDEEPIGVPGLLKLAKAVYGDMPADEVLNPLKRELKVPEFKFSQNPIQLFNGQHENKHDTLEQTANVESSSEESQTTPESQTDQKDPDSL